MKERLKSFSEIQGGNEPYTYDLRNDDLMLQPLSYEISRELGHLVARFGLHNVIFIQYDYGRMIE